MTNYCFEPATAITDHVTKLQDMIGEISGVLTPVMANCVLVHSIVIFQHKNTRNRMIH